MELVVWKVSEGDIFFKCRNFWVALERFLNDFNHVERKAVVTAVGSQVL